MSQPKLLIGAAPLAPRYPVWLCDVWGVVHDGRARFDGAVDALARYRASGGFCVLITNAPRPKQQIEQHLATLGVPRDAYDAVVTSGDVTRELIASRGYRRVLHIGPIERDRSFFDGLDVELVDADAAECIACTGLFEEEEAETPDQYHDRFEPLVARDLTFYCANPDRVVRSGKHLIYCAGALADIYSELGGRVVIAGKPHVPIYDKALSLAARGLGRTPTSGEVLAIGDGIETDMRGAAERGYDALFALDGIHAAELGVDLERFDPPQAARVARELAARLEGLSCVGIMPQLVW
jgi:HAD superfamily hydrolase (TIGR01459 family)